MMNVTSVQFIDSPVYHQFPPIYENLGLREVSSFYEQRFEFSFTSGKRNGTAFGSIRQYQQAKEFQILVLEKITGLGPKRLEKLKELLLEQTMGTFIENLEKDSLKQKVYYSDFRRTMKE